MKPTLILFSLLFALPTLTWAGDDQLATSPTEGVISHDFLGEQQMKSRCLAMLSRFMPYVRSIYKDAGKNKEGEPCGYFMARNSGQRLAKRALALSPGARAASDRPLAAL